MPREPRSHAPTPQAVPVDPKNVELEGPYECPTCGGNIMLDATFLDQVGLTIACPYCQNAFCVPEKPAQGV